MRFLTLLLIRNALFINYAKELKLHTIKSLWWWSHC